MRDLANESAFVSAKLTHILDDALSLIRATSISKTTPPAGKALRKKLFFRDLVFLEHHFGDREDDQSYYHEIYQCREESPDREIHRADRYCGSLPVSCRQYDLDYRHDDVVHKRGDQRSYGSANYESHGETYDLILGQELFELGNYSHIRTSVTRCR